MAILDAISSCLGLARRKKTCRFPGADKPYEERQPSVYGGDRSANYRQHELMAYPTPLTNGASTTTSPSRSTTSTVVDASKDDSIPPTSTSASSSTLHESPSLSEDELPKLTRPPKAMTTEDEDEYFHRLGYTCHFTKVDMRKPLQSSRLRASMRENFGLSERHFASRRGLADMVEKKIEVEEEMRADDGGGDEVKKLGMQGKVDSMLMGHWPRFEFDD